MNNIKTTIVSAFIAGANNRTDRSVDKYIEYGKILMDIPIHKIILIDDTVIDKIPHSYYNEFTTIIPLKKKENYLYEYKELITDFNINSTYPLKDTLEYMFNICNKTEYVRKAIEIDTYNSEQFIWVDFGIRHMCRCNNDEFREMIMKITETPHEDHVHIGAIWKPTCDFSLNIYKDVVWYFAGCIFGSNKELLIKFADLTKEMCIRTIKEKHTIMWEVNIWRNVYLENFDLFSLYYCDHNESVIKNY